MNGRIAVLRLRAPGPAMLVLGGILLAALGLRLWAIKHGMPWAFNRDEEEHFVPIAVQFFETGSLNPGYFENPPALTYLLNAVFRLRFGVGFPFGSSDFVATFEDDPEAAYVTARVTVALIGTAVVALVYWAGRRFYDRRVGLVAAALIAFTFLPVFYSHFALNDVVTMAPVAVALAACALLFDRGALWQWALAGAAIGTATATKYTAGAMLITLGVAALGRLVEGRDDIRRTAAGAVVAGACCALLFVALNPYALIDFSEFKSQLGGQSSQASGAKLGQEDTVGWLYYARSLLWGFGLLPTLAAVAGGVLAFRADRWRGLMLAAFPLFLFLYLGAQGRYFGRWLLPIYPALAIMAAYGAVRLADSLPRLETRRVLVLVGVTALLVLQGLASSMHVNSVLERRDTRSLARDWLERNVRAGSKVAFEPIIPADFLTRGGRTAPERYELFPVKRPFQAYERTLNPKLVARYRRQGYCWVVTGSHQKDRGLEEGLAGARRYYRSLDRATERKVVFSPYYAGEGPVGFSFDFSFNYLPRDFERPGPLIEIHRLRDCPARRRA